MGVEIELGVGPFDRAEEKLASTADTDLPTIGVLRLASDRLGWVLQHAGFEAPTRTHRQLRTSVPRP